MKHTYKLFEWNMASKAWPIYSAETSRSMCYVVSVCIKNYAAGSFDTDSAIAENIARSTHCFVSLTVDILYMYVCMYIYNYIYIFIYIFCLYMYVYG